MHMMGGGAKEKVGLVETIDKTVILTKISDQGERQQKVHHH